MTVTDRITALWPTTELLLKAATDLEVPYIAARGTAVTDAITALWRAYAATGTTPPGTVDGTTPAIEQQTAELAVLQLIPYAQDWYAPEPTRQGPEGGDVTLQDQVKRLSALAAALITSTEARETRVAADIRAATGTTVLPYTPPTLFTLATGGRGR